MSFMTDKTQEDLIKEFARICGVKSTEVNTEPGENKITLKTHIELKNEARDVDVTVSQIEKDKYNIEGILTVTGPAIQKLPIKQEYKGNVVYLPKALGRLLNKVKVKKSMLAGYFG